MSPTQREKADVYVENIRLREENAELKRRLRQIMPLWQVLLITAVGMAAVHIICAVTLQ